MAHKPLRPPNTFQNSIPVGNHRLKIVDFQSKKSPSGNPILDKDGNITALTAVFEDSKGRQKTKNFPLTSTMLWMLESLSNALNINLLTGEEYDVETEVIGRYVYATIVVIQFVRGGIPVTDENGNIKSFTDMDSKFYEDMPSGGPVLSGNPSRSNPTGAYLKYLEEK